MNYEYEAVIVLAGGVKPDKTLPAIPKARVDMGVKIFFEKKTPRLIFSGHFSFMFPNPLNLSESEAMRFYAISRQVPDESIITEDKSKETLGNAYFTKVDVAIPQQLKRLAVITSDFHIIRTEYLFGKVYGPDFQINYLAVPTPPGMEGLQKRKELERKQFVLAREWLDSITNGDDQKIGEFLFSRHPGYASNPKISRKQLLEKLKTL